MCISILLYILPSPFPSNHPLVYLQFSPPLSLNIFRWYCTHYKKNILFFLLFSEYYNFHIHFFCFFFFPYILLATRIFVSKKSNLFFIFQKPEKKSINISHCNSILVNQSTSSSV